MTLYAAEGKHGRLISRALLRTAAHRTFGWTDLPEIARHPHGKPFFPTDPERHFNLSHSGAYALCALDSAPVGVDIQVIKPFRQALYNRVCNPSQRAWLRELEDDPRAFALLWALKESRCKQSGRGLTSPISAIEIPIPTTVPWRTGDVPCRAELDGLSFTLFSGTGWCAALCGTATADGIAWVGLPDV